MLNPPANANGANANAAPVHPVPPAQQVPRQAAPQAHAQPVGQAPVQQPPGQVPVMAAQNVPPTGNPVPQSICTYQDYFAAATNDPHNGNYAEVMRDFAAVVQGNSRYNPQTLF